MNTHTHDISHFRELLVQRRQSLARHLADLTEEVKLPSSDEMFHPQPADQVDLGSESADSARLFATAKIEQQQLNAIDAALERIGKGAFGVCESCGSSISERRLELVPETTMCMDCKRAAEEESVARRKGP
jgi:RNA polymerase-binding protein DksA